MLKCVPKVRPLTFLAHAFCNIDVVWAACVFCACDQPYSWDELINGYKDRHITYKAGGLAKRLEPGDKTITPSTPSIPDM